MHDPLVGKVFDGRYEILARIGEGGMGVVYKARQVSIDRVIAIKVLNPQMASDQQWVQRFSNEAKACSRLQHPNTIRMFDFGQTSDGRFFMTMEFLEGNVLRAAINNQPMAPNRVMKVLIQCCASLAEAHAIGIIHRDIKPDNVFLLNMAGSPDFVKLLDFSVAKLLQEGGQMKTQAGVVFGTPQYMSPEQGRGLPLDARSDLYALGILGYEMLTGRVPFNDDNPMTVLQMHLRSEVPPMPPSVPANVQNVIKRALDKEPGRRYQSAGEMMQHCQQVFAELSGGVGIGVAGGGAPKTMIAPGPGMPGGPQMPPGMAPPGMMPPGMAPPPGMMPPGMAPPPGAPGWNPQQMPQPAGPPPGAPGWNPNAAGAGAAQKTMIAGMPAPGYPGGPGGPPPGAPGGYPPPAAPPGGPGGYQPAGHAQKTMIAGLSPLMMPPGGPSPMAPPPGMSPQGMPQGMPMGTSPGGAPYPGAPGGPPQAGPQKTMMLQPTEGVVSFAQGGPAAAASGPGAAPAAGGASTGFWIGSILAGAAVGALAYVIVLQL
ncbi:MAG: serine/threonine protein kinase [Myxococcales bacterium]|nr:serine/threonine protein kinase [Myxococcales bacterium]MBK7198555.1 serine/threonine protein kinase [Myxococcales bacterium]